MGKTVAEARREEAWIERVEMIRVELRELAFRKAFETAFSEAFGRGLHDGEVRVRRAILVRQLRRKFRYIPKAALKTIAATEDVERLDGWLDRLVTARSLAKLKLN